MCEIVVSEFVGSHMVLMKKSCWGITTQVDKSLHWDGPIRYNR